MGRFTFSAGRSLCIGTLTTLFLLTGCTYSADDASGSTTMPSVTPSNSSAAALDSAEEETEQLGLFEQQLPLRGSFVSQRSETVGSVSIERLEDGTTWVSFVDFSTGTADDMRVYLTRSPLEQDSSGAWVTSSDAAFEVGVLDPTATSKQLEVRGADLLPEIRTLIVTDYGAPGNPSLGSAALSR